MLKAASIALAERCVVLTSVARTERSLRALDRAMTNPRVVHHLLALDWTRPAEFLDLLVRHVDRVGRPSRVVAWFHHDSLGPEVAQAIAPDGGTCDFFQIRGSAAADPSVDALIPPKTVPKGLSFHQIILGFHVGADGSRWLRHSEICAGVLAAIDRPGDGPDIIGTVTPWSARP
jgi:hypothetical protein